MLKKIFLICFLCLYAIACNEEPNSPNDQEVLLKSNLTAKSDNHKVIMGVSSPEKPLSKDERIKNKIEFETMGNISDDDENSSLTILSNDPENYFLPREVKYNSKDLSYKVKDKMKSISMKDMHDQIKQIIKNNKMRTDKWKDKDRINWEAMTLEEKLAKYTELGYEIKAVGSDFYVLSRDFDPLDNGNMIHIKTVIDIKTQMPKSSKIYKDNKLVSEHLNENMDGNLKTYSKVYSKEGFRDEKNFLIVKENK